MDLFSDTKRDVLLSTDVSYSASGPENATTSLDNFTSTTVSSRDILVDGENVSHADSEQLAGGTRGMVQNVGADGFNGSDVRRQHAQRKFISLSDASRRTADNETGWLAVDDLFPLNRQRVGSEPTPSPSFRTNGEREGNDVADGGDVDDTRIGLERLEPDNPWFGKVDDIDHEDVTVRGLDHVLDLIDIDRLWNGNVFRTTLGTLMANLVRLFTTRYEKREETTAVRMLREAMFRGAAAAADTDRAKRSSGATDFWETYRSRAAFLVGWTKYRRHIEEMESQQQIITRKHKTALNLLYVLLSSADVRVYRDGVVDESTAAFIDPITGYELPAAPLLTRPLTIEMRTSDMFGNIGKSARLLDRSVKLGANNVARRKRETESVDEILALFDTSVPLAVEEQPAYEDDVGAAEAPIEPDSEHSMLREMLTNTMIVSMMAEEFRVFTSDTSQSASGSNVFTRRTGGRGGGGYDGGAAEETSGAAANLSAGLPKSARYRKPVFYVFDGKTSR